MKAKNTKNSVTLTFDDATEAYSLLNAIYFFKHGDIENKYHLSDISLRNNGVYELSVAIENYLETCHDEDEQKYNFSKTFKLDPKSYVFKQVFDNLRQQYIKSNQKIKWNKEGISNSRKWLKHYFAPCIIDDDLADYVAAELEMIGLR